MRAFILLGLVAFVVSQRPNLGNIFGFGDRIHGYSFQYHRREDLLLVRNSTACFIVETTKDIAAKLEHKDSREMLEDAIYKQIKADQGETVAKLTDLRNDYHDVVASFECFRHKVYKLTVASK